MAVSEVDVFEPTAQRIQSYIRQGLYHYEHWEAEKALHAFQRAIRLAPTNPDHHLLLARAYARFGELDQACEALRAFLNYESVNTPVARRMRRLLQEQEAQKQIRAVRERLDKELQELEKQSDVAKSEITKRLTSAVEQSREEAQRLRRWMQANLIKVVERDVVFRPSGQVIIHKGEAITEKHLAFLEQAVQEYLQEVEARAEEEAERQERALESARQRSKMAAEGQVSEIQERNEAVADPVEIIFAGCMQEQGLGTAEIEAARRMWLEFRICAGRANIYTGRPETWAAGVDYTVRRVNFREGSERDLAHLYRVSQMAVRVRHNALVENLDIMPCDYRYFVGQDNPLDRLVEAATMLEKLEERFRRHGNLH